MNCLCSKYTRDTAKLKHTELHFMINREFKKLLVMMMMMKVVKHLSIIPLNPIRGHVGTAPVIHPWLNSFIFQPLYSYKKHPHFYLNRRLHKSKNLAA
jgi:hypothetical protein